MNMLRTVSVFEHGRLMEVFTDLSLQPVHSRYAAKVLAAESRLIRARAVTAAAAWPAAFPVSQRVTLRAGRDGSAAITALDVTGDPSAQERWGARLLEAHSEVGLVAAPDLQMAGAPPRATAPACCPGTSRTGMGGRAKSLDSRRRKILC